MKAEYPQELRSEWADLNARKCSAIWRLVDARHRLALLFMGPPERITAQAALVARLEAEKDELVSATLEALKALRAAEAVYYRKLTGCDPDPFIQHEVRLAAILGDE